MSGFRDPIIGGGGALVYPSIHSPNFVSGSAGWSVNKDGSAEFADLVIRGTFFGSDFEITSSGLFFYSSPPAAGNLIASYAPTVTSDSHGNTVKPGGWCVYGTGGQDVFLGLVSGLSELQFPSGASFEATPARVVSGLPGSGPAQIIALAMHGGQVTTAGAQDHMSLQISSNNQGGTSVAQAEFIYFDNSGVAHTIMAATNNALIVTDRGTPGAAAGQAALCAPGGNLKWVAGSDGNAYNAGAATAFLASPQTINTVADTPVTGLQFAVVAATYRIRAVVAVKANQTAGTATLDMHGPAISGGGMGFSFSGAVGTGANWSAAGYPTGGIAMNNGQVTWITFEGVLTFSASGTVSVQAHTSLAADTFVVQQGSFLQIVPAG